MKVIEITEETSDKMRDCLHRIKNFVSDMEECLEETSTGFRRHYDDRDYRRNEYYGERRGYDRMPSRY